MNKQQIIEGKIVKHQALTFDDILLLPGFTDFKRSDADLSSALHPNIILKVPIISSPMDTVTEAAMAIAIASAGGLGVIHRNVTVADQASIVRETKKAQVTSPDSSATDSSGRLLVGAAVGIGSDFDERLEALIDASIDLVVIDSGHGYTKVMVESVKTIKSRYPSLPVMAGNIATYDGASTLIEAGADMLRVGMGPGSICTTRIVTGMGVPQISAIAAVVRATERSNVTVIADGGIRQMGDMAKALAFGAQAVMLGSLLARMEESPGERIEVDGKRFKSYRGMGSVGAMKKGGAERYGQLRTTEEKKLIAEGVEGLVPISGSVGDYMMQVSGSIRSSFYYIGAKTLTEFFEKSRVIKISNAGLLESHPHNIAIVNSGKNYNIIE